MYFCYWGIRYCRIFYIDCRPVFHAEAKINDYTIGTLKHNTPLRQCLDLTRAKRQLSMNLLKFLPGNRPDIARRLSMHMAHRVATGGQDMVDIANTQECRVEVLKALHRLRGRVILAGNCALKPLRHGGVRPPGRIMLSYEPGKAFRAMKAAVIGDKFPNIDVDPFSSMHDEA